MVNVNDECGPNGYLPYLTEKDIIIVNLEGNIELEEYNVALEDITLMKGERTTFIIPRNQNYFNPAYLFAYSKRHDFEKIVMNGGIIIVFADILDEETYYPLKISNGMSYPQEPIKLNNYEWIPMPIYPESCSSGNEIFTDNEDQELMKFCDELIRDNINEVEYNCKFKIPVGNTFTLFRNKLNEVIGYIQIFNTSNKNGALIVFPQFTNKHKPLIKLFTKILPELKPDFFPQFVQNQWVNREEYILPNIGNIYLEKEKIIEEYEDKLKKLDEEIDNEKYKYEFLTNILISSGFDTFLVDNIYETLKYIGYKDIVKVDEQVEGNRQEDLEILDGKRFTVIEVKGHNGNPNEDDCQAVLKYINRQMRKEKRTDIHGILIVNHNKVLPPLDRSYPAFTGQQIEDGKRDGYTLVSTWELYKAVRLFQEGILSFKELDIELHTPGLFKAIPSCWRNIGKVEHLFKNNTIACFYLEVDKISKNDEIIIQDNNCYFEQIIDEMMINEVTVDNAKKGEAVSIKINQPISKHANIFLK